jgi:tellurite resistance protein TehA-like permease
MSTEPPNDNKKEDSIFFVSIIIFAALVIAPTLMFLKFGGGLLGERPVAGLLILCAVGGALSSSISAKGFKRRLLAIIPGVMMGVGVPLAFFAYISIFQRNFLLKVECVIPTMIGILPGGFIRILMIDPAALEKSD